jgi:DNA segregation ATPase FtsK/SpoIIIE, S-DNA-T family
MSQAKLKSAHAPLLPQSFRLFLHRRLSEIIGFVILMMVTLVATALATWNIHDPSFNHATNNPVQNWLGFAGASISDLLLQVFGLGANVFLLPPLAWSVRFFSHQEFKKPPRMFLSWILGSFLAAGAISSISVVGSWPLPSGLGGLTGDLLLNLTKWLPAQVIGDSLATLLSGILLAIAAFFTTLNACRMRVNDVTTPFGALSGVSAELLYRAMGPVTHTLLSIAGFFRRLPKRLSKREKKPSEAARALHNPHHPLNTNAHIDAQEGDLSTQSHFARFKQSLRYKISGLLSTTAAKSKHGRVEPHFEFSQQRSVAQANMEIYGEDEPLGDGGPNRVSADNQSIKQGKRVAREGQPMLKLVRSSAYELPPVNLITIPKKASLSQVISKDALEQNARLLEGVLDDFGIRGEIIKVRPGPVVTLYELEPAPGIKSSRVIGLADDIARSMSALSVRVAVVPGRNVIGIEMPNAKRNMVYFRELLASQDFESASGELPLILGKNIGGDPVFSDLARMPHLLIAGTTGSGKSVGINTMILSLLFRFSPDQCKLIMIDPKMLELSVYDGIPHLLAPVVTDPKKAVVALKWAVKEMEERYRNMSKLGVRNIDGFNSRLRQSKNKGAPITRTIQTGFDHETGEPIYEQEELNLEIMPYIVIVVDEMADLMMVAGKDIEGTVQRLAQMARAAGIHLITATQRPSVDVITGTIKANFPTRVSFQVTSKIDSRTILGEQGAEQLLGQGDMLFMSGGGRIVRIHAPFVADDDVEKVVNHLKRQGVPEYLESITLDDAEDENSNSNDGDSGSEADQIYDKAVNIVLQDRKVSTSYIQRRLSIGYNRAATIIEKMEHEGVISPANHAGKREILVGDESTAAPY